MASSPANDLTSKGMEAILKDNGPLLLSMIRIEPMFVAQLVQYGAITSEESENVQAIELPGKASQYLFNIIKGNLEYFIAFCIVLHEKMKRDDIVRDMFHLNVYQLKRQKREMEEKRKKEADENKRLEELEKQKQAQRTTEPSTTDTHDMRHTDPPATAYKPLTYRDVTTLLTDHKGEFYDRFDPNDRVRDELKTFDAITAVDKDKLTAAAITSDDKIRTILDAVKRGGVKPFLNFCHVLYKVEQGYMVTEVLGLNMDHIQRQRGPQ